MQTENSEELTARRERDSPIHRGKGAALTFPQGSSRRGKPHISCEPQTFRRFVLSDLVIQLTKNKESLAVANCSSQAVIYNHGKQN